MRRLKSLEFRIPLITGVLVLTTVGVLVASAYLAIRTTTLASASARLLGSSNQLAALVETPAQALLEAIRATARAPAVVAFSRDSLARPSADLVEAVKGIPQPDRLLMAEFRDSAGRQRFAWRAPGLAVDSIRVPEIERMIATAGPATLGAFRSVGDSIVYPVGAPVNDGTRRLGYVIHWRAQQANSQAGQLAALFGAGPGSVLLLGDTAGTMWMDFARRVPGPPNAVRSGAPPVDYRRPGGEDRLVAGARVNGTPWLAAVDAPRAAIMQPVRAFLIQISAIAIGFLVVVFLVVWWVSRSVTTPLGHLADAANAFRKGEHGHRVRLDRDDELQDVAIAFNQMADSIEASFRELRDADEKKDRFLATLAHELRNPLAALQNSVETLRAGAPPSDSRSEQLWGIIERQVVMLTRLVDDLLEVSRITRGTIVLAQEKVDLSGVVQQALESAQPLVAQARHQLTVEVAGGLVVEGDRIRLAQILFNLLQNAAKYTPAGGAIALRVYRDGPEAVISVKDTGRGIPHEMLDRIFEMFVQLDDNRQLYISGLGVGLSLVRELTALHGGTVSASSAGAGLGSEFIVRLPLAAAIDTTRESRPSGPRQTTGIRAMVVDDNEDAADSLAALLRLIGVECSVVYSGEACLQRLLEDRPSVIFLDIGMPGMDGYKVARRVRANYGRAITLVAVTGWGREEDRARSHQAGFDHHLVKPVAAHALHQILDRLPAPVPATR